MKNRHADYPIDPIFIERWSPRAFAARTMPKADLMTILEAARWAPSAYNIQPWRFIYALRGDAHWTHFLDLLVPFNAAWAGEASALVFIVSDKGEGEIPAGSHSFDAGAAWAQLALQATRLGYQVRGMAGIERAKSKTYLKISDRFHLEIAIAVGVCDDFERLPDDLVKGAFENERRALNELVFAGTFPC